MQLLSAENGHNDDCEPAFKFMIEDLRQFVKRDNFTGFTFNGTNNITKVNKFQIQGTIIKITGFSNEIFIIDDGTGKAKVVRGTSVPGDFSWLQPGVQCSVVGRLQETGKLPQVLLIKLAKISNKILLDTWPFEVEELKNFFSKKILMKADRMINSDSE